MKKVTYVLALALFIITSCTGVKSTSSGIENEAFLEFVGQPGNYKNGVEVSIDGNQEFTANVNKEYANRPKGKVYAISPGSHTISVSYNSDVVYRQQIFLSNQETKQIKLQ